MVRHTKSRPNIDNNNNNKYWLYDTVCIQHMYKYPHLEKWKSNVQILGPIYKGNWYRFNQGQA